MNNVRFLVDHKGKFVPEVRNRLRQRKNMNLIPMMRMSHHQLTWRAHL